MKKEYILKIDEVIFKQIEKRLRNDRNRRWNYCIIFSININILKKAASTSRRAASTYLFGVMQSIANADQISLKRVLTFSQNSTRCNKKSTKMTFKETYIVKRVKETVRLRNLSNRFYSRICWQNISSAATFLRTRKNVEPMNQQLVRILIANYP